MIILTDYLVRNLMTSGSGFNKAQAEVLCTGWKGLSPPKGWLQRLIGTHVSELDYNTAWLLKGKKRADRKPILEM